MERSSVRGQASVEFLLIILIFLIYLQAFITPSINLAATSVKDTSRLAETRLAAEQLVFSINEVASFSGNAKKTIWLFVPEGAIVWCTNHDTTLAPPVIGSVYFKASLDDKSLATHEGCAEAGDKAECTKSFAYTNSAIIACGDFQASAHGRVVIQKVGDTVYVGVP